MPDNAPMLETTVPLTPAEHSGAGEVLGRAFYDDAQWVALVPDPEVRRVKLPAMFTGVTKLTAAAHGLPERTPGFEAVGLWLRPEGDIGAWAMVRSGFAMARWALLPPYLDFRRMMSVLGRFDRSRKETMTDPHWYLMALGVDPTHQGQGHGSTIVRAGMDRANREGKPLYLEAEAADTAPFYTRLGFETIGELVVPEIDLTFSLMAYGADRSSTPGPIRPGSLGR